MDISSAERVGFEPTVRFPAHTLSRRASSTTPAPLHSAESGMPRFLESSDQAERALILRVEGARFHCKRNRQFGRKKIEKECPKSNEASSNSKNA